MGGGCEPMVLKAVQDAIRSDRQYSQKLQVSRPLAVRAVRVIVSTDDVRISASVLQIPLA